jgi:hypothetical protein
LARELPNIEVRVVDDLHAKMVLIAPATVYIGSANFVRATLQDVSIGVRGAAWHDHYAKWFDVIWEGGHASLLPEYRRGESGTTRTGGATERQFP